MCCSRTRATCGRRNNGYGCGSNGQGCCGRNNCNPCSSITHLNGCSHTNITTMPISTSCGRRRGGCGSREPIALTLGKMAYEKYRTHQAMKQQQFIQPDPVGSPRSSSSSSSTDEDRLDSANSEVLKGAGIAPPSYDAAMKEPFGRVGSVRSSPSSSFSSNGQGVLTPPTTVGDEMETGEKELDWRSKKDLKKAQKAARKAEKWAGKARERGWIFGG